MSRTRFLPLAALLFVQYMLTAQTRQYSFLHYGVANGLAAYNVRSIVQDQAGFIWIGTINGLQRYDGTRFLNFRHNPADTNSIPDNYVEQLLIGRDNRLWLVLKDGSVGTFDTRRFVFRHASVHLTDENNLQALRKLQQDSQGNLFYVFLNNEILAYDRQQNRFEPAAFQLPDGRRPVNFTQDPLTRKYWIGTDSGMVVYNPRSGNTSYSGHNIEQEPLIEQFGKVPGVAAYGIDTKRRLWFLSWPVNVGASRLYCYNLESKAVVMDAYDLVAQVKKYIEPDFFLERQNGEIWISGLNVFARFRDGAHGFELVESGGGDEQGIFYERVNLFEDREQNIWVATSSNGIYLFNPSQQLFRSVGHTNRLNGQKGGGYLLSFEQMPDRTILSGVWGDGIYRYDSNFNNLPLHINGIPEVNGLPVWDICRPANGGPVWLVGQPGFIFLYDPSKKAARRYDPAVFEGRTIRQIAEDGLGNMWLGSQSRGLIKWSPPPPGKNFEDGFYRFAAIGNMRVQKIMVDKKGYVWVCTNKAGVYRIDPANDSVLLHLTKNTLGTGANILGNDATSILQYNDSLIVIATAGLDIYNMRTGRIRSLTSADGLPSDAVMSMEKDRRGNVWLGLMNGLCRVSLDKAAFTFFDRSDGIANDNFQIGASCRLPDGRLLFGSSNDFVVFDPENIQSAKAPPDVVITEFRLFNRSLLVDSLLKLSRVELSAGQNSIRVGFEGLSFLDKTKPVYFYKLDGIDKEWKRANETNEAVYSYLPAGNYLFRVRAENADGVPGKKTTLLAIKIRPPFWKTWWFACLVAFGLFGVLYWLDNFRVSKIRETERVRTRIATSLTRDMSSTLGNINVLSELAKVKAERDMERTKEYISQISDSSNRMMEVMDDMIWSINPENDELQHLIARMKKYASQVQAAYDVETSFHIDPTLTGKRLHMDRRHELFLIFKEALLNTGKHSGCRFAEVDMRCEHNRLRLKIADGGRGFDTAATSFGRGITDMRKKAAGIGANLQITSEINNGTTLLLIMPLH